MWGRVDGLADCVSILCTDWEEAVAEAVGAESEGDRGAGASRGGTVDIGVLALALECR